MDRNNHWCLLGESSELPLFCPFEVNKVGRNSKSEIASVISMHLNLIRTIKNFLPCLKIFIQICYAIITVSVNFPTIGFSLSLPKSRMGKLLSPRLRATFISGKASEGHMAVVDRNRCKSERSNRTKFYLCTVGWFLCTLRYPSLSSAQTSRRHDQSSRICFSQAEHFGVSSRASELWTGESSLDQFHESCGDVLAGVEQDWGGGVDVSDGESCQGLRSWAFS